MRHQTSLALLALALASGSARAEEPAWKLEETWRYDLALETVPSAPPQDPSFLPLLLVSQSDLQDGRRPTRAPVSVGDLVWHYALALPAQEGEKQAVQETFRLHGLGPIEVTGEQSLKKRGKRLQARAMLRLGAAKDEKQWLRGGGLRLERQFVLGAESRLERCSFTLELSLLPAQGATPVVCTWAGTIAAKEQLRPGEQAFPQQVSQAIDKGAGWLLKATRDRVAAYKGAAAPERFALGRVALPVFALLRSGTSEADLKLAWEWIDRQPLLDTYSVSVLALALEARSVTRTALPPLPGARSVARYDRRDPPAADKERLAKVARWLIGARKPKQGWWSYFARLEDGLTRGPIGHDGTADADHGDRSNSQFALLALHAAQAAGIEVPPEVWEEVLKELLEHQCEKGAPSSLEGSEWGESARLARDPRDLPAEGTRERAALPVRPEELLAARARGWAYQQQRRTGADEAYGSMTAAGVSSLQVACEALRALGKLEQAREREALLALRDGLAWWVERWDPATNPGTGAHYYYCLYSLEKALDLCGVDRLGPHEWWRDLAAELLARQKTDGSWEGSIEDTSFALLVLNRATLPARLEVEQPGRVETGAKDPSRWDRVNVPGVGQVKARQVLRALLLATPKELEEKLPLARACLEGMDPLERPRLLPELADLLRALAPAARKWAKEQLKELAGSEDPARVVELARRFEQLRAAREGGDHAAIPVALAPLREKGAPRPLERAALATAGRLRAVEGVPEVLRELEDQDPLQRAAAWEALQFLCGAPRPFDPQGSPEVRKAQLEAWRALWSAEGQGRVREEEARRAGLDLQRPERADAAAAKLRALGAAVALRPLVDALRAEASRARAHALLKELSGQDLPPDPARWIEWLEKPR